MLRQRSDSSHFSWRVTSLPCYLSGKLLLWELLWGALSDPELWRPRLLFLKNGRQPELASGSGAMSCRRSGLGVLFGPNTLSSWWRNSSIRDLACHMSTLLWTLLFRWSPPARGWTRLLCWTCCRSSRPPGPDWSPSRWRTARYPERPRQGVGVSCKQEVRWGHLGVHGVRVRLERRLDPARLQPAPVDRVEPGVDLHLPHSLAAWAATQAVGRRLLEETLA